MWVFLTVVHVFVSIFIIFVILLQPGKGDGMAAFSGGGGSSQTVFGGRGSVTFLSKVTTVCAIVFMITSLTLAWRSSHSASVLQSRRNLATEAATKKNETPPLAPPSQTAPAPAPAPAPAAPAKK
jgi:preprotein translocase subunit SecG